MKNQFLSVVKISLLSFVAVILSGVEGYSQMNKGAILMTIGNDKVTVEDFLSVYKKNNNKEGTTLDKKSMEEYLCSA